MTRITPLFARLCALAFVFSLMTSQAYANNYASCVALVSTDADAAYDAALDWEASDLSGGASHCAGLALARLGLYDAAAERFTRAAVNGQDMEDVERATLHRQAGDAWLISNKGPNAVASFTEALKYIPEDPALLYGRARGYELAGQPSTARDDLTLAIHHDPSRASSYLLRARVNRQMKQLDAASTDIEAAIALGVDSITARLERGLIRYESGDEAGALEDWQAVVAADRRADGSPGPAGVAASGFILEVSGAGAATQP